MSLSEKTVRTNSEYEEATGIMALLSCTSSIHTCMQQADLSTSFAQLIQQEHPTVTPSYGQQRRHVALHKLSLLHFHALHLEPQTTTRKAISSISTQHNDSMLEYIA